MLLRIAGMPPLMAQAPIATRTLQVLRNSRNTWTFSALHTPPSTMPTSHGPQCLMSVSGVRSNSASSTRPNRRSSISRSDMWQPKQPAREQVAMRTFCSLMAASGLHVLNGEVVEYTLADRHGEAAPLHQNRPGRAHLDGLVGDGEIGIAQQAAGRIDDQDGPNSAPGKAEHVLAIHLAAGAHAKFAVNAAVAVEHHIGMGSVRLALRIEVVVVWTHHAEIVGYGLELAVAAFLACRAEVIALDEQHLRQGKPFRIEFRDVAQYLLAFHRGHGAGRDIAPVDVDGAQLATAVGLEFRVMAQVRNVDAGRQRRVHDGLAFLERHA